MIQGQNHIAQNIWSFEQMQLPFKGWLHASESSSCWKQAVHWQWSHPKRKAVAIPPSHAKPCLPHVLSEGPTISCRNVQMHAAHMHEISLHFRCLCIAYDLGEESIMHRTGKSHKNFVNHFVSWNLLKSHDVWKEFPEVLRSSISLCLWQGSDSHWKIWKDRVQLRVTVTLWVDVTCAQVLGSNGLAPSD